MDKIGILKILTAAAQRKDDAGDYKTASRIDSIIKKIASNDESYKDEQFDADWIEEEEPQDFLSYVQSRQG